MKKNIILLLLFICIVNACTISNRSKNSVEHKINPIIFIPSEKIKENKMWIIEDSTILDTIEIIFNIYILNLILLFSLNIMPIMKFIILIF